MTLVEHLKVLPRRLLRIPTGLLMVLSMVAIVLFVEVLGNEVQARRAVAQAREVERLTLQRQQLEATQALVEEVRKLRETLEDRR